MTNEKLKLDGTLKAHELGCMCDTCHTAHHAPLSKREDYCIECNDTGYQATRSDPTDMVPCTHCRLGHTFRVTGQLSYHKFKRPPSLESLDPDKGHPVTCTCAHCEAQRQRMRTPPKTGVCQNCADTGYTSSLNPDKLFCTYCDTGADLAEASQNITFADEQKPVRAETAKTLHNSTVDEKKTDDPWKHRSTHMTCSGCMWYVDKEPDLAVKNPLSSIIRIGRCRRHAPTMNGYPVVYPLDWCGDHKLDETKL